MNKMFLVVPVLAGAALLTACGPSHSGQASAEASSAKASASAFANSAAGKKEKAQAQALVKKCFPSTETAQLKLAEPVKGKAARQQVEACLEIPKGTQRTEFDQALLGAALSGNLKTKAGRVQFAEVTGPELVLSYKGKA